MSSISFWFSWCRSCVAHSTNTRWSVKQTCQWVHWFLWSISTHLSLVGTRFHCIWFEIVRDLNCCHLNLIFRKIIGIILDRQIIALVSYEIIVRKVEPTLISILNSLNFNRASKLISTSAKWSLLNSDYKVAHLHSNHSYCWSCMRMRSTV